MSNKQRIVIVGGSDAGIAAALRIREVNPQAEVEVYLADDYPNFSICGLPFFLSGETPDWRSLAHRTEFPGIAIHRHHTVSAVDPRTKSILCAHAGETFRRTWDRLILATGARPSMPDVPGLDLPGVFPLHTMDDSFGVAETEFLEKNHPRRVTIIGSGYIGLEMADALTHRGLEVTLIGRSPSPLATVDSTLGRMIEQQLESRRVRAINGTGVTRIARGADSLQVCTASGFTTADLVLVGTGVEPNSDLALTAGIDLGFRGAIRVDRSMRTNISDIFAAGDCGETWHRLLNRNVYLPLGTTAHKQGRIAGENAAGGNVEFGGSLGTQVVKVFDLAAARTGLRDEEAREAGFDPLTVEMRCPDHKAYYPGAAELTIRVTGDQSTERLLGAQIVGHWKAEVSKRIDIFAVALFHGMDVAGVIDLDLSYTPPMGSPWDAVQLAALGWSSHISRS